ncbi:MAG: M48 family metalloprotease [Candidatus Sulfotelmatobacter sp.]
MVCLGIATGAEAIYSGLWQGALLLAVSGVIAMVAGRRLRSAEGLRLRPLRSGKLHGRAFQLAKKMSVSLQKVYIVPAGRGHLTNAYGMPGGIALTDNYGDFANGGQLDFIIGHELTHVKRRHGLKQIGFTLLLYALFTIIFFRLPPLAWGFRAVIDLMFLLLPVLGLYSVSRRFEYSADRGAVEFTANPAAAIEALENLYRATGTAEQGRISELFQTHPTLSRRVAAIASLGKVSPDRRLS